MDKNYNITQGDKILSSFSFFTDKEEKLDRAMDYYKKASKEFIEKQDFMSYSLLAEKIGNEFFKIDDKSLALTHYKNAQKYYLNLDIDKYLDVTINKIIPLYIENSDIKNLGKTYHQLAKLTKSDGKHEKTIEYYQLAVSYLETENSHDLFDCYTDYVNYLLDYGDINCASRYIELIINYVSDSRLLVYKASKYIFLFLLCAMTKNDTVLVKKKLDEYCELMHRFAGSAQCKLIENLNEAHETNDVDKFTDLVYEYNVIYKFNPHEVNLLLNIKKKIQSNCETDLL
jgi:tetratricopeptide (TPR) repeat protein